MKSLARFKEAPVTVGELKGNIFAPLEKISSKEKYILSEVVEETENYIVSIKGIKLNQIHRDILDIALFYGDNELEEKTNTDIPVRTFSLYMVLDKLKHKYKKNQKWLEEKFDELKQAVISIYFKTLKQTINFSIIRVSQHSHKQNNFVLVFEDIYFHYFQSSISINYKSLLQDIIDLKYPQTKAIVRYLLSFTNGHQCNINTLLFKVGVKGVKRNVEKVRARVLEELKEVGERFNITLSKKTQDKRTNSDYTISYKRHKDIKIYYPPKKQLQIDF